MSKIKDNEQGVWKKTIVNPDETLEKSSDIISYATEEFKRFDEEKRVITSMVVEVNYCNTDGTDLAKYDSARTKLIDTLKKGLLMWEESSITLSSGDITNIYKDNELTMRDSIIRYLDVIVAKGMLNVYQYNRFVSTLSTVYKLLTGQQLVNIDQILKPMEYDIKYYPATKACPDEFHKLSKIQTSKLSTSDNCSSNTRETIDAFIKKWFKSGKIYDKDRDEFYMEFTTMYESLSNQPTDEDGIVTVSRRLRSRKVMAVRQMMNYSDINKILKENGLDYHISYQQETDKSSNELRRRNSLSLKHDSQVTN